MTENCSGCQHPLHEGRGCLVLVHRGDELVPCPCPTDPHQAIEAPLPCGTPVTAAIDKRLLCRCVWLGRHCPNPATQEDGLCDWCTKTGARTEEQLRENPRALIAPDGTYMGQGGAGELHDAPLADELGSPIKACWYPDSDRTLNCLAVHGLGCERGPDAR